MAATHPKNIETETCLPLCHTLITCYNHLGIVGVLLVEYWHNLVWYKTAAQQSVVIIGWFLLFM